MLAALSLAVPQTANAPGVRLNRWALNSEITALAITRDSRCAAFALADGSARLVPLRRFGARKMAAAMLHQGRVEALCADCNRSGLLSAGTDGRLLTVDSDGFAADLVECNGNALSIDAVDGRRRWRAVGYGEGIALLDRDGRGRHELSLGGRTPRAMALAPDGRSLAVAHADGLMVWRLDGRATTLFADVEGAPLEALCWRPNGRDLAGAGIGNAVTCWTVTGEAIREARPCLGKAYGLSWTSDGKLLIGRGADSILCWPFVGGANGGGRESGRLPFALGVMDGCQAISLCCHPRHAVAAAGYGDGCVLLADLARRVDKVIKHAGGGATTALAWSPDGDFLAAASDEGDALLFDFTALRRKAVR